MTIDDHPAADPRSQSIAASDVASVTMSGCTLANEQPHVRTGTVTSTGVVVD